MFLGLLLVKLSSFLDCFIVLTNHDRLHTTASHVNPNGLHSDRYVCLVTRMMRSDRCIRTAAKFSLIFQRTSEATWSI
jgi:hypothetical protein